MVRLLTYALVIAATVSCMARGAAPDSQRQETEADTAAVLRAENKLLRATSERQAQEIKRLQGKMDRLLDALKERGITEEELVAPKPKAPATPDAPPDAPAAGPASPSKQADRVAFVIDASGSMISTLPTIKTEVLKAVATMGDGRSFAVLVVQDDKVVQFDSRGLVPASQANVKRLQGFLRGVTSTGTGSIEPGVEAAVKLHPQVVWLATDGDFPDVATTRQKVKSIVRGRVRVNTLAATVPGSPSQFARGLWDIARDNRGVCVDAAGKRVNEPPATVPPQAQPRLEFPPRDGKAPGDRDYGDLPDEALPTGRSIFDD